MKKIITLLFFAGTLPLLVSSQTLSPTVISSSGGFYTSGNAMLSFTVAEMTMVQTFSTSGNILTQGFQQPEDYMVGITETQVKSGDILIYPNPTNGNFTLDYYSNINSTTTIKLLNLVGQVIWTKSLSQIAGQNTVTFDISTLSQGIYMLELITTNNKGEEKTNYHKIDLVY